jgi:hypothetical protein
MRIFVTGATGFLGKAITAALLARGERVIGLSRGGGGAGGIDWVRGDPAVPGDWQKVVAGCDAVVHLAGEPIAAGRLDGPHRDRVMESRRLGTRHVAAAINAAPRGQRPRVLLSSSGTDFYPFDESDRAYTEQAGAGDSFLAEVCKVWEAEARAAEGQGTRVAILRNGIVIGPGGGALAKMVLPFKLFAGGPMGSGRQWFSWVSLEDTVGAYLLALRRDDATGPINVVAPGALRQKEFARALGQVLGRPSWAPVPGLALRAAAGGLADYLLHGRRVVPGVLSRLGYAFRHADAVAALREAV